MDERQRDNYKKFKYSIDKKTNKPKEEPKPETEVISLNENDLIAPSIPQPDMVLTVDD
jgi:hypothetical protein